MMYIIPMTFYKSSKPRIYQGFAVAAWRQLFGHEERCVIHQSNNHKVNDIIFFPYFTSEKGEPHPATVAVFRVKRKLTNMMIADNIINQALQTSPK